MNQANKWLVGLIPAALIAGAGLWEGTKYYAYYDIVGVPTVCKGHTGPDVVFGKRYSVQECENLLRTDLKAHTEPMLKCINVPINKNEYIAYGLFTLNVGVGAFCKSTALKLLNAGKHMEACDALMNWVYAGGKKVQGLVNRRTYERDICRKAPDALPETN